MGFFKNINANMDFEALERYIKTKGWRIDGSSLDLFNTAIGYWGGSFETVFDHTWSFKLVNGTYMIDSNIFFDGSTYREVHALKDTGVLFQAMINKVPIHVVAAVKRAERKYIIIRLTFDINNGDRIILAYEIRRKMKIADNFEYIYKQIRESDPNYNFKHNYEKQQQKLAKHHSYNSQYRFKK